MPEQPTARARIERAFHVSFKLPEQAAALLDAYRDQVLTEAAELLRNAPIQPQQLEGMDAAADLLLTARTAPDAH